MPQDETAIDQNPKASRKLRGGSNDYRLGWGTSGFYATTDNGITGTTDHAVPVAAER